MLSKILESLSRVFVLQKIRFININIFRQYLNTVLQPQPNESIITTINKGPIAGYAGPHDWLNPGQRGAPAIGARTRKAVPAIGREGRRNKPAESIFGETEGTDSGARRAHREHEEGLRGAPVGDEQDYARE